MGEIRTFRDDDVLKPLLDTIPRRKMGKIIRRALYDYFFKGKDIVMAEDEDCYIEVVEVEEVKIKPVKEIKFDMFED